MVLLQTESLARRFGGIMAVDALDLNVTPGEIVGLIGPNGAGKSTVLNLISGALQPSAGKVIFKGEDITGKSPNKIAKMGKSSQL